MPHANTTAVTQVSPTLVIKTKKGMLFTVNEDFVPIPKANHEITVMGGPRLTNPPRFYLLGWWLSPRRRYLGILLALQEHPLSCIFYKILQCAGLWFHQMSHSRLWPRSRFLSEDRKDADHPSWLAQVPNRGYLAWLLATEDLKATSHVLPGCWEQLVLADPAHSLYLCLVSALMVMHTGGGSQTSTQLTRLKKILTVVWLLSKPQLCLRYCLDWPFSYTSSSLNFPQTW